MISCSICRVCFSIFFVNHVVVTKGSSLSCFMDRVGHNYACVGMCLQVMWWAYSLKKGESALNVNSYH